MNGEGQTPHYGKRSYLAMPNGGKNHDILCGELDGNHRLTPGLGSGDYSLGNPSPFPDSFRHRPEINGKMEMQGREREGNESGIIALYTEDAFVSHHALGGR